MSWCQMIRMMMLLSRRCYQHPLISRSSSINVLAAVVAQRSVSTIPPNVPNTCQRRWHRNALPSPISHSCESGVFRPIDCSLFHSHRICHLTNRPSTLYRTSHNPAMAALIDGKQIAQDIRTELSVEIQQWIADGHRAPQLTAIIVGEDPASQTYVRNKMKAALEVGINSTTRNLPTDVTEAELLALVEQLNNDPTVDGILVQLPVPAHINERRVCNAVRCDKDVDGFNELNVGRLCLDMRSLIPATPLGVVELLKRTNIETFGKNVVVCGRSKNVGMPIAMLLHSDGRNETNGMDATVTMCHRFTPPEQLKTFCLGADIIVTATGVPNLIRADMVKPGACIIDVGLTRVTDPETGKGRLVGDVDFEAVRHVVGHITPVPGGVGPMTVAMLMRNTFTAAKVNAAKV